jgi:site-specific DNA-methyltransferase (adenine-specific)
MDITDKIRIHNEDCLEALKKMPDNAFELAIVDPPYGIERLKKVNKGDKIHKASDSGKNYNNNKPSSIYFDELFRVSKNQIIWGANNFVLPTSEYFCIWDKKQGYPNFARCEYAFVSMGLKKPAKIFEHGIHQYLNQSKIHPTQKPVKLYEWLLDNYAKEGDRILDTHLGSGSIAIACHNRGYNLTAYEIDKDYFEATTKRIQDHITQLTLF